MKRRTVLGTLASSALLGVAGCLGDSGPNTEPEPTVNEEVPVDGAIGPSIPQLQGGPAHTGRLDETVPTDGVTTYWRRTPYRYEHSQPVVVDDGVYVSFAGRLVRLALSTGEEQWQTDVGHAGASTPAVYDGTAYVTVWNGGEDVLRGLAAVDTASGDITWRGQIQADITTSPTATADGVFVGGGFETATVAAYDHDGTERWQHELSTYASTPAVAEGIAVYGSGADSIVAYDADTGDQLWTADTDGETTAPPTISGGNVYIGTRKHTLYAVDLVEGTEQWTVDLPGEVRQSAAVADGRVFVPAERGLVAVDATGTKQWVADEIGGATEPALVDGTVLLGDGRTVRAVAAIDGTEQWSFETRDRNYTDVVLGGIDAAPTVANGAVLVATNAGDVYALGSE
ncbi:Pyrrolo-quinoline quinone [Halorubrum sp. SD683]|nr:Pyrrolo-quinoline quinone [Halorubrum sp. SD683]